MTCRNVELAEAVAALGGAAADGMARCGEPAAYRTRIHRELTDDSVVVTIRADLCHGHDAQARSDAGYGGSWVKRT
jgi:hypothetical protein